MNVRTSTAVLILVAISGTSAQEDISKVTGLRAVTKFDGYGEMEAFYRQLHEQQGGTEPQQSPNLAVGAKIRREICKKVFTSPFFRIERKSEWVDVERKSIAVLLRDNHRSIFDSIFNPVVGYPDRYLYVNPYAEYRFPINGDRLTERVFVCVVKGTESEIFEPYFVSREYNVNLVEGRAPIAGRFIFSPHTRALAEQHAASSELVYKAKTAEYQYIKHRQVHFELGPPEEDPVCKLSPINKLRLCVSIFASKTLRRRYVFTPKAENVYTKCRKKRVAFERRMRVRFLSMLKRKHFNKQRHYEEYMIGCNARRIGINTSVTYLLSRGDAKNTVFAYKHYVSDDKVRVKHYFKRVSVVDSAAVNMLDLRVSREEEGTDDDGAGIEGADTGDEGAYVGGDEEYDNDTNRTTTDDDSGDEIKSVVSTSTPRGAGPIEHHIV